MIVEHRIDPARGVLQRRELHLVPAVVHVASVYGEAFKVRGADQPEWGQWEDCPHGYVPPARES